MMPALYLSCSVRHCVLSALDYAPFMAEPPVADAGLHESGKDRSRGREPPEAGAGLHESGKDRSRGREPPVADAGLHERGAGRRFTSVHR